MTNIDDELKMAMECSKIVKKIHRYDICNKSPEWREKIMSLIYKKDLAMWKYEPEWFLTLLRHYTEDVRHLKALQKKQIMKRLAKGKPPLSDKQQKSYDKENKKKSRVK